MRKVLLLLAMVSVFGVSLLLFHGSVMADDTSVVAYEDLGSMSVSQPLSPTPQLSANDDTITTTMVITWYTYLPWIGRSWPPIPTTPELYAIDLESGSQSYDVTWSVSKSESPVAYTLQEATQADFSDAVDCTTTLTTTLMADREWGTYYYRVRATNMWGDSGWSNVQSITIHSFYDSFDSSDSGWSTRRTSSPDLDLVRAFYEDGELITRVDDRFDFGVFSPMREAPEPPYTLMMRTRIIHEANEVSYGMVFGGNGGELCPVDRDTSGDNSGCFFHYYRLNVIWGGYLKFDVKRIEYHEGEKGKGRGDTLIDTRSLETYKASPSAWNDWQIRVYENGFAIYVNGSELGWTYDTSFINDPYYGIFSSTYEYNSAAFEHEHFYVEPISPEDATMLALPSPDEGYLLPGTSWYVPAEEAELWLDNAVDEDASSLILESESE